MLTKEDMIASILRSYTDNNPTLRTFSNGAWSLVSNLFKEGKFDNTNTTLSDKGITVYFGIQPSTEWWAAFRELPGDEEDREKLLTLSLTRSFKKNFYVDKVEVDLIDNLNRITVYMFYNFQ